MNERIDHLYLGRARVGALSRSRMVVLFAVTGGAIALMAGQASAQLDAELLWDTTEGFPQVAAGIGDVNGDGVPDIASGFPDFRPVPGQAPTGRITVHSGVDGGVLFQRDGSSNSMFGSAVAGVGDVNSDGVPDFAVGSSTGDPAQFNGQIDVLSGTDGSVIHSIPGTDFASTLGLAMAALDDVDGDGVPDFAAGEPGFTGFTDSGFVRVFSGASGAELYRISGPAGDFGVTLANAGDVNADGVNDIVVGKNPNGVGAENKIEVFSGTDGAAIGQATGVFSFGSSVAGIGDVTGDGRGEILVGIPIPPADPQGFTIGRVQVISFPSDGTPTIVHEIIGDTPLVEPGEGPTRDDFGDSVAGIGDLDGDSVPDFIVGAPTDDAVIFEDNNGSVSGFSGADGSRLFFVLGQVRQWNIGGALALAGDLNGDGVQEFVNASRSRLTAYGVTAPCPADIDGDGDADVEDFFEYLDLFAAGDSVADVTGDGILDADDFFGFLSLFTDGCP